MSELALNDLSNGQIPHVHVSYALARTHPCLLSITCICAFMPPRTPSAPLITYTRTETVRTSTESVYHAKRMRACFTREALQLSSLPQWGPACFRVGIAIRDDSQPTRGTRNTVPSPRPGSKHEGKCENRGAAARSRMPAPRRWQQSEGGCADESKFRMTQHWQTVRSGATQRHADTDAVLRLEDPNGHRDRALDALRQETLRRCGVWKRVQIGAYTGDTRALDIMISSVS